jgi:hypothetical protein
VAHEPQLRPPPPSPPKKFPPAELLEDPPPPELFENMRPPELLDDCPPPEPLDDLAAPEPLDDGAPPEPPEDSQEFPLPPPEEDAPNGADPPASSPLQFGCEPPHATTYPMQAAATAHALDLVMFASLGPFTGDHRGSGRGRSRTSFRSINRLFENECHPLLRRRLESRNFHVSGSVWAVIRMITPTASMTVAPLPMVVSRMTTIVLTLKRSEAAQGCDRPTCASGV